MKTTEECIILTKDQLKFANAVYAWIDNLYTVCGEMDDKYSAETYLYLMKLWRVKMKFKFLIVAEKYPVEDRDSFNQIRDIYIKHHSENPHEDLINIREDIFKYVTTSDF